MKLAHDIIIRPIITEAAMDMMAQRKYVFEVAKNATKPEIAKAVEEVFASNKVKVECVRIVNMKKKPKRLGVHFGYTSEWKKAIVTLTADSGEIEFFAGLN
ncbi:MAG: 50S ribosomal protein L23 [Clostridia bacterium]|nr:50S ribosomal protein L23 [Clostridia bacterium]